ncbi:hypothetical protein V5O48_013421 [Marasmius crinis-equi]|uniref:DUF6532 domain-containing protein n=1 Tax=Marasmius crinis-equi TaxID=585013 RepID=A0ABR3F044_9AGAR
MPKARRNEVNDLGQPPAEPGPRRSTRSTSARQNAPGVVISVSQKTSRAKSAVSLTQNVAKPSGANQATSAAPKSGTAVNGKDQKLRPQQSKPALQASGTAPPSRRTASSSRKTIAPNRASVRSHNVGSQSNPRGANVTLEQKAGSKRPPAHIDVNAEESSPEPEAPRARKKARHINNTASVDPSVELLRREEEEIDVEEEDNDGFEGSDDDMEVEEREYDGQAMLNLDEEAAYVVESNDDNGSFGSYSRASSTQRGPPASEFADGYLSTGDTSPVQKVQKIAARKAKQLKYELPVVDAEALPTSRRAKSTKTSKSPKVTQEQSQSSASSTPVPWLDSTKIVVTAKQRSWELKITGQSAIMRSIMDKAITLGKARMLSDDTFCPVSVDGLKRLALASLLKAAEDKGHGGEYDICHRLETGDNDQYTKPLISYVSGRIGNERRELKNSSATVLTVFGFPRNNSRLLAGHVVQNRDYFYPFNDDEIPKFDYARPMENPAIVAYVAATFFSPTHYGGIVSKSVHFTSSIITKPNELEVPPAMVALACTAIHACLHEHSTGHQEPFPTKDLEHTWTVALDLLKGIKKRSRSAYHTLLHDIYRTASSSSRQFHGNQVVMKTDWSNLEARGSDNENSSDDGEHSSSEWNGVGENDEGPGDDEGETGEGETGEGENGEGETGEGETGEGKNDEGENGEGENGEGGNGDGQPENSEGEN